MLSTWTGTIRLGAAKVTCVYRRRQEDMTAQQEEVEGAIAEGAGSHFDPEVVEALLARQDQFDRLRAALSETA